ncbi:glycosyltransferase [Ectopseudomonas guguanensis]|uniref:glycosyltransferase n=1 Tax=Ectopseudomonas guguanensis TaxID=1198456 RepID=UPI0039C026D0
MSKIIMNGSADSGISIFTCVRDASIYGGGISGVALPVHAGLYRYNARSRLLSEKSASTPVPGQVHMGGAGSGFGAIKEELPSVVHVHGMWTPFEIRACNYARRLKVPLVVSPHGMLEPWAFAHKRAKKWLAWHLYQRRCLESADLLLVNSLREYQTLRSLGLKPPIAVIENGVDDSQLNGSVVRSDSRRCVLFLSRLSPVKGIMDLLRAWQKIPVHDYELRIYGHADPGYADEVGAAIRNMGLSGSVALKGPVFGVEKWQAFKNSDIFVLPSYSENFGIVVAESLLAGVPVITTQSTPWQCLEKEGLGWIVENNVEQLAGALSHAMSLTDAHRKQMGAAASVYAREHFLWPKVIEKYCHTYAWLTGRQTQRPAWIYEG